MDRTSLAALAGRCKTKTALKTALVAHLRTDEGKATLASAPLTYSAGLPRPMTTEEVVDALLQEAAAFLPKPKTRRKR